MVAAVVKDMLVVAVFVQRQKCLLRSARLQTTSLASRDLPYGHVADGHSRAAHPQSVTPRQLLAGRQSMLSDGKSAAVIG